MIVLQFPLGDNHTFQRKVATFTNDCRDLFYHMEFPKTESLYLVHDTGNDCYINGRGYPSPMITYHMHVGLDIIDVLTRDELIASACHELAHARLGHIEKILLNKPPIWPLIYLYAWKRRQWEKEADILAASYFPVKHLCSALDKMHRYFPPNPPSWMSLHPPHEERLAYLRDLEAAQATGAVASTTFLAKTS